MTETPKPPKGWDNWVHAHVNDETWPDESEIVKRDYERIMAELSALRAERDRLRELLTEALPWASQYEIAPMWSARVRKELAK